MITRKIRAIVAMAATMAPNMEIGLKKLEGNLSFIISFENYKYRRFLSAKPIKFCLKWNKQVNNFSDIKMCVN